MHPDDTPPPADETPHHAHEWAAFEAWWIGEQIRLRIARDAGHDPNVDHL